MKKKIIAIIATLLVAVPTVAFAQLGQTTKPSQGGTGTSTSPVAGDLLVGNSLGLYQILHKGSNGTCLTISGGSVVWLSCGSGGGGSPGGNNTEIQFNEGGAFGGTTGYVWDSTNRRVGIGTTSPYATLSVVGQVVGAYFTATTTRASTFPYASTTMVSATTASTSNLYLGLGSGLLKLTNGLTTLATAGTDYLVTVNATTPLSGSGTSGSPLVIANALADGSTKGAATFTAADFDSSSGLISIDYTNGQAASGSNKGFLTSADWTTFNNKQGTISTTYPITLSGATVGFSGLSTSSPWTNGQVAYVTSNNAVTSVATGTASCSSGVSCSSFTVIGSSPSITNSGVTSIVAGTGINVSGATGAVTVSQTKYVATSSGETSGQLAYWSSTNGTPATLDKVATTSVTCSGSTTCPSFTVIGSSPITISSTGGAGGAAGTWSTTTSQVSGRLINYSNNTTDIPCIGGSATSTCKWWFDPNLSRAFFTAASTTQTTFSGPVFDVAGSNGTAGQILMSSGGVLAPRWVSTTTPTGSPVSGFTTANSISTVINTSMPLNDVGISSDTTFTFSATPPTGTWFGLHVRNFDNDNYHTITFPSSHSQTKNSFVTTTVVPNNVGTVNGDLFLYWYYDGTNYHIFNDFNGVVPATGQYTTVYGYGAGTNAVGANFSAFFGYGAGNNSPSAGQAVAVGYNAGNNPGGYAGTFVGYTAGQNGGGVSAVGIGYGALGNAAGGTGTGNIAIGVHAAENTSLISGTIAMGYHVVNTAGTVNNSVIIGDHAATNIPNASNSIFLGPYSGINRNSTLWIDGGSTGIETIQPLLYGEFDNDLLLVNGRLGVGVSTTSNPTAKLTVGGEAKATYFTATSTTVASTFPYASTTAVSATTICLTGDTCRTTWPSGGSGSYPFTPTTNYGVTAQATTGILWLQNGLQASSTSQIAYASTTMVSAQTASTTNLTISSTGNNGTSCLQVSNNGLVTATCADCGSGSGSWATTSQNYYNSQFRDWSLVLSGYLAPTTTVDVFTGTSTPNRYASFMTASNTPAIFLNDLNGGTNAKHFGQFWNDGLFTWGTSTDAMNSTSSAMTLNPVGLPMLTVGSSTPVAVIQSYTSVASSTGLLLEASSKGGCMIFKDVSGSGYTQMFSQAGVVYTKVATSLTTCN